LEILNRTELKLGYLPNRKNFPGHSLTTFVKGTFRLVPDGVVELADDQPAPTGDEPYLDDDEGQSSPRYESDCAPFKPRTDLLLVGSCYPPGGVPVPVSRATFGIGPYRKTIGVIGDREQKGLLKGKSEPAPFAKMEVRYENAFGGTDSKRNPVGKGWGKSDVDGKAIQLMPNLEDPNNLIKSGRDRPDPVGFGPIDRRWEDRFRQTGTYKGDWLKTRFPALPDDFNWGYYNCAPLDLQPPYIRGDEEVFAENLHPKHAVYRSTLPGLRIRVFLQEKPATEGASPAFREVPMNLDTVWVDMDEELVVLVWRGLTEVKSAELDEVGEMLIVSEPLDSAPQNPETYRSIIPEMLEEIYGEPDEEQPPPPAFDEVMEGDDEPVTVPGEDPTPTVARISSRAELEQSISEGVDLAGSDLRGLDLSMLQAPEIDFRGANLQRVNLVGANLHGALLGEARLAGADLSKANLAEANFVGARLMNASLIQAELADADFSKCAMKGAVLSGAKAEGALFDFTDLRHARLDGMVAPSASFDRANLADTNMEGATFSSSYFGDANLTSANCRGSNLENADWSRASGVGVNFEEAKLKGFRATASCDLRKSSMVRATGAESVWADAILDEANFSFAEMEGATFDGASLQQASFHCADIPEGKFSNADLTGAKLTTMNLFLGSMEKANLTRADLSGSNMYGVEFIDAVFQNTVGEGTNLKMTSQDPRKK